MVLFSLSLLGYIEPNVDTDWFRVHSENSSEGILLLTSSNIETICGSILDRRSSQIKLEFFVLRIEISTSTIRLSWPSECGEEVAIFDNLEFLKSFSPQSVRNYIIGDE